MVRLSGRVSTADADEEGAAVIEFALILPLVLLLSLVVLHAGVLGADLVSVQGLAREAARAAAAEGGQGIEGQAGQAVGAAAGRREVEVTLTPRAATPGELVTATVRLRSRGFAPLGAGVWLPGRASMRVERTAS